MVEVKPFSGIMDSDSPLEKVNPLHHIEAFNVVFRGEAGNLRVENVKGNRVAPNASLPLVAQCPVIGNLKVNVKYQKVTFSFSASNAVVTNYTVNLRNSTTNAVAATQNIAVTYGVFDSIAPGSYYIEVVTHCTNTVDSSPVTSNTVTVAAPTCAAITGLTASVSSVNGANNIYYGFNGSVDDVTTYTVDLMSGASVVATQNIAEVNGVFTSVADGTYTVRVTPNCSNGLTGSSVVSGSIAVTTPANVSFILSPDVETSEVSDALIVRCTQGTDAAPAPFNTLITVHYFATFGGGSPVEMTESVVMFEGATMVYVDARAGVSYSTYDITHVSPTTDGTNVYTY